MGAATCAVVLQPLPISHHFHGCTALLVLRFVVVKWRYIRYKALPFFIISVSKPAIYALKHVSIRYLHIRQLRTQSNKPAYFV